MSEPIILHNYVGGEFIAPSTGQYLDNPEPAVGTILSHVPKSNAESLVFVAVVSFVAPWFTLVIFVRDKRITLLLLVLYLVS